MQAPPITEQQMEIVINWIDTIPFSRPKKNLNRDFADGILMAQIMDHEFPKWVDLHNYPAASSSSQKYNNWNVLNQKVFKKQLKFQINKTDIQHIITGSPDAILKVLRLVQKYIENYKKKKQMVQQPQSKQYASEQKIDQQLQDKDLAIKQLRETIEILELKLKKMDQLNKLKDAKIQNLTSKLTQAEFQ